MEDNKTMMAAVEDTEIAQIENEEIVKETFITKIGKFGKKHAKKIAAGAVVILAAAIGHAVGKKAAGDPIEYEICDEDEAEVDMTDSDMESEE